MRTRMLTTALLTGLTASVAALPAMAQKKADTIRYATSEAIKSVDPYFFTLFEAAPIYRMVYETLIRHDDRAGKFVPHLAKSWKVVEPGVYEFDLREDVTFHNGAKLDADDVVYIMNWTIDPKVRIHNKNRYTWVKSVEKLGPYKVRITAAKASPADLLQISLNTYTYDSETHKALKDPEDYGRNPVGTGPYKITKVDPNTAVTALRFDGYKSDVTRPAPRVARLDGLFIPDQSVQIAQLITGGIEIMRDPSPDQMSELGKHPELQVSTVESLNLIYLQYDVANRAGNKAMTDVRVRQALSAAINRDELVKHVAAGGHSARVLQSMCFEVMIGCELKANPPPAFDPAKAKKLLAEAGYATGLEVELVSRQPSKDAAVAIAGYWNAVGVKTSVQLMTVSTLDKARSEGKLQAYIGERPWTSLPDASYPMTVFFETPARDYWRDAAMKEAGNKGAETFDEEARKKIYQGIFSRINEEAFMLPVHSLPNVFIHQKDVKIYPNAMTDYDQSIADFGWK